MNLAGLELVPGYRASDASCTVLSLPGGLHNRVSRVDTPAGSFVLHRFAREELSLQLGVDRQRQLALQAAAAAAGLAPAVLEYCSRRGVAVMAYQSGALWQAADWDEPERLAELCATLRALHRLPVPHSLRGTPVFDALTAASSYAQLLQQQPGQSPAEFAAMLDAIASDCAAVRPAQRTAAIAHCDLHSGNILRTPGVLLLDWEYAQIGDPLLDPAAMIAYQPALAQHAQLLLQHCGLAQHASVDELLALSRVFAALNSLWSRVTAVWR
jgi:aminoglycoside phosphotransferase (APT) family kinase protein